MIFDHTATIFIVKSQRGLGAMEIVRFLRVNSKIYSDVVSCDHHSNYKGVMDNTVGAGHNCIVMLENIDGIPDRLKEAVIESGAPTILIEMSVLR